MKSDRVRALLVFVSGMVVFLIFAESHLFYLYYGGTSHHSISPATLSVQIILAVSILVALMGTQMRFRTQPRRHDQDGGMAAWVLPVMFVLGIALCAAVWWVAFRWASGSLL
jgi:hypothetical protein